VARAQCLDVEDGVVDSGSKKERFSASKKGDFTGGRKHRRGFEVSNKVI